MTELVFPYSQIAGLFECVCQDDPALAFVQKLGTSLLAIHFPARLKPEQGTSPLIHGIEDEHRNRLPGYGTLCNILLIQLLMILYRYSLDPDRNRRTTRTPLRVEDIIALVENKYAETFSLEELAGRCGLNPSYFSRIYREKSGMSLFEHINKIRISKAAGLLKNPSMTVIEIAYAVGYNNLSFFNRYFKRIMKVSPREYRQFAK